MVDIWARVCADSELVLVTPGLVEACAGGAGVPAVVLWVE